MNRSLLALNVGSASVKAAGYLLSQETGPQETGRVALDLHDGSSTNLADPDTVLSSVTARLSASHSPDLVVHRIVHGGDRSSPLELNASMVDDLEALSLLAPLHQPPALALARSALRRWPDARHYGAFDTSWHLSMPERHRMLPLPASLYDQGVRHYGFHGLAFQSAMRQLVRLSRGRANGRVILAHLGGGSSLCAVRDGRCVTTTMGMTPLGGIPMSTRPGSLDPGVILHLQRTLHVSPDDLDRMLWTESGLKGLSGESGDMRVLLASSSDDALRAIEIYTSGVAQGIAAMAACTGGIDLLAFSGGIGLHAPTIRARVADALSWLGLELDDELNRQAEARISGPGSTVHVYSLSVDEEFEMAEIVANHVDSSTF